MPKWTRELFIERLVPKLRFDDRVSYNGTPCWLFTGSLASHYGNLWWKGKHRRVHRLTYLFFVGAIPKGLVVNHLCEVKRCCNPDHLEVCTDTENKQYNKGWCWEGHDIEEEGRTGKGQCKRCAREYMRRYRARQST